jgi:hypothetical protein
MLLRRLWSLASSHTCTCRRNPRWRGEARSREKGECDVCRRLPECLCFFCVAGEPWLPYCFCMGCGAGPASIGRWSSGPIASSLGPVVTAVGPSAPTAERAANLFNAFRINYHAAAQGRRRRAGPTTAQPQAHLLPSVALLDRTSAAALNACCRHPRPGVLLVGCRNIGDQL